MSSVSKISTYYFKTFFLVLFAILGVVISFQSFLYFLKLSSSFNPLTQEFLEALLSTLALIPLKISDFLPLAVYMTLGVTHSLWKKRHYWLTVTIVGFQSKDLIFLKTIQFFSLLILSSSFCWFVAPWAAALNNNIEADPPELTIDPVYLDGENYYHFLPTHRAHIFNLKALAFKKGDWRRHDHVLFVDYEPVVNTKVLEESKRQFSRVSFKEKLVLLSTAPGAQKTVMKKVIMSSLLNPLCVLLSLCLGWIVFSIAPIDNDRTLSQHSIVHIFCCSLVFLTQNILPEVFYLTLGPSLVFFLALTLLLFLLFIVLDKVYPGHVF